ncbi:DUF116 domain-containing protein [bacterium]|nr:DUF116 domain-containing protein [bacterium]
MTDKQSIFQITDRKLGDEWQEWQGNLSDADKNANTGKRTFLALLYLTICVMGGLAFFIWYMISPRLAQFHPDLPLIIAIAMMIFWGGLTVWFFLIVLSIITAKDFSLHLGKMDISLTRIVPLVLKLGNELGVSMDRMANSFVKVRNALLRTNVRQVRPDQLLILLPRCLHLPLQKQLTAFAKKEGIHVATVPGGEKARQLVMDLQPLAVIGVACERDLLSGIRDVSEKLQVIGIPNIRPEGPCKNTLIDLKEFEGAVQTFLGKNMLLQPFE